MYRYITLKDKIYRVNCKKGDDCYVITKPENAKDVTLEVIHAVHEYLKNIKTLKNIDKTPSIVFDDGTAIALMNLKQPE